MSLLNKLFKTKPLHLFLSESHARAESEHGTHGLSRQLSVIDLTAFGIAAIIGAGSFSALGSACFAGGTGVVLLFIITAIACGFAALCYAEFASHIPVSGSAYTYAYASFGELAAWIIGWALLMEYSIGNIYVAFVWSDYFTNLLSALGLHFPEWLTCNYIKAHANANNLATEAGRAWANAPQIGDLRVIFDLPAVLVNIFITFLVYIGIKESRNFSNAMVFLKLTIVLLVIIVGAFYVDTANWSPFLPNGFGGVMAGVSGVFFAYIGFDAVSTLAEETKNPQRDLPRGMLYSLAVCTVVYILLSLVLTGVLPYTQFEGINDPLAYIFEAKGVKSMLLIVSVCAVVAMTSVLLVFQMGQPRIWMSMSRDGLLPKKFSEISPKYKTPSFATLITGLVVGIPLFFTDENFVLDFTSIGTLFAFVLVCGGVLFLPTQKKENQNNPQIINHSGFKLPYIDGKFIIPILLIISFLAVYFAFPNFFKNTFNITAQNAETNVPLVIYFIFAIFLAALTFIKNLSLIPVLGLYTCCYLLTGMRLSNWKWFGIWLVIGLAVYFMYGYKNSKLQKMNI